MSLRTAFAFALFAGLSAGSFSQAQAADYIATSPAAISPVCQEQGVINRAVAQFDRLVRGVPEMPAVSINAVSNVSATRFDPKTYPSGIERHYCRATAVLSNGENRNMWYMVEKTQGFASMGSNVESCVDGFDKWFVYDGRCRVLR
ncbi:phage portal protein [Pseudochrobactrum kiredjianiae]|uniref:Phage portal protein n=1 Tax=Pseudochrobactrum kiredjianiae TaxID=386305 RepID=A0ABW3VAR5_9HYPH|nr:phage portal protein [Pseudochrobactrum kiredjianiae]MDM7851584.1 phage portal protein [Pseudochrobactrum kiredjianiae]